MEIIEGYDRFEDIKRNAYWSNVHIDTRFRADRECMDDYLAHLKDCEKQPTTGFLAKRKYITGKKKIILNVQDGIYIFWKASLKLMNC